MKLKPDKEFSNNAFLLNVLYNKASGPVINVDFAKSMLLMPRQSGLTDEQISGVLGKFGGKKAPYDLQSEVLDSLSKALKSNPSPCGQA